MWLRVLVNAPRDFIRTHSYFINCEQCDGAGMYQQRVCRRCHGEGMYRVWVWRRTDGEQWGGEA
jgi:DnaJ-class molecular chaperone